MAKTIRERFDEFVCEILPPELLLTSRRALVAANLLTNLQVFLYKNLNFHFLIYKLSRNPPTISLSIKQEKVFRSLTFGWFVVVCVESIGE